MPQDKHNYRKPAARWHQIRVIAGLLIVCSGWGWMFESVVQGPAGVSTSFNQQQTG